MSLVIKLNVVSGSKGCPTFSKLLSSARLRKEKGGKKEPGGRIGREDEDRDRTSEIITFLSYPSRSLPLNGASNTLNFVDHPPTLPRTPTHLHNNPDIKSDTAETLLLVRQSSDVY